MARSLTARLAALAAAAAAPAVLTPDSHAELVALPNTLVLDFDTDAAGNAILHGQVIDDEYASWGVSIDVQHPSNPAYDFGLALSTAVSIEADMRTGQFGAYHATNTAFLGNVLIAPRNNVDGNADGIIDIPDTAYQRPNGVFTFTFADAIYDSGMITILDAEEAGGTVEAWLNGTMVGSVGIPALSDNAVVTVGIPQVRFNRLVVKLAGSGGLNDVTVSAVPEPASLAALTLLATGLLRRR